MNLGVYFVGVCGSGKTSTRKQMARGEPREHKIPISFLHKKSGENRQGKIWVTEYQNFMSLGGHNNGSDGQGTVEEIAASTEYALKHSDIIVMERKIDHLNPRTWQCFWENGGNCMLLVHMNLSRRERIARLRSRNPNPSEAALRKLDPSLSEERILRQMIKGASLAGKDCHILKANDGETIEQLAFRVTETIKTIIS